MKTTPALILAALALMLTSCSGPTIAEKPRDAMDQRAAAMGYGRDADEIQPSAELESLSEDSLKEYDGSTSAVLLQDYLQSANKKKR